MRRTLAIACASALVLTACGTKGGGSDGGTEGAGGVQTDVGVTDSEITLGVMTDQTGPFKALSTGITHGNELWVEDVNADGGICGRDLKLEIVDHGYKADTAKTLYPQIEPKVLGLVQLVGSPVTAALSDDLEADEMTTTPTSWSSELLSNPYLMVVGTTYDVEMINGLSYLQEEGMLSDGDTIGHIYIDGEYGANGLRGARYYAEQHDLNLREVKITSSDNDLTNVVTGLRGQGVKAITLTTTPTQTGSVAAANKALGLNVPILGNNPTFDPLLHNSPAADALDDLHVVASSVPFSADIPKMKDVAQKFDAAGYTEPPNAGVPYGYAVAEVWGAVLERACENGDLTRSGVHDALRETTSADTGDLVAKLDFSTPGAPATREVYVAKPDASVDGGMTYIKQLFESEEAKAYKAPHQE
ncbi:ABC-type branched-subunit amino acid transport system substrate-binding protein [Prauserella sediminis]|uniref:ABC-type branched-subunit amino acid transport system substrate-binding protein n=1 Tax=Prauserella sediminis TaxID=577680 RepID=A0A839XFV8_9PSEU|nr:ABC transporter substrate-binding protein [Prauserella sediminis]MBB3661641.1 ABC-type branched-subunit amino acid transport system substrate-binding protein [Prauserella sediminis]